LLLQVVPNGAFQTEIEANAARGSMAPEIWLRIAIHSFLDVARWLRSGDGLLGEGKGARVVSFGDHSFEEYQALSPMKLTPGIGPADLGGYPLGTTIWNVEVDDDVAATLQETLNAPSPYDGLGYAVWRQSRFANTLREDYPGWEPGLILADGIFRSLSIRGAMKRLPGSSYDPIVPPDRSTAEKAKAWAATLTGSPVHLVDLDRRSDPLYWRGMLYSDLRRGPGNSSESPHRSSLIVPSKVLNTRPLFEAFLLGADPETPTQLFMTLRTSAQDERENILTIDMEDLLGDPAPLAEVKALLDRSQANAFAMTAAVVGCCHGLVQYRPRSCCPAWELKRSHQGARP
jgi:hypothetical protein